MNRAACLRKTSISVSTSTMLQCRHWKTAALLPSTFAMGKKAVCIWRKNRGFWNLSRGVRMSTKPQTRPSTSSFSTLRSTLAGTCTANSLKGLTVRWRLRLLWIGPQGWRQLAMQKNASPSLSLIGSSTWMCLILKRKSTSYSVSERRNLRKRRFQASSPTWHAMKSVVSSPLI